MYYVPRAAVSLGPNSGTWSSTRAPWGAAGRGRRRPGVPLWRGCFSSLTSILGAAALGVAWGSSLDAQNIVRRAHGVAAFQLRAKPFNVCLLLTRPRTRDVVDEKGAVIAPETLPGQEQLAVRGSLGLVRRHPALCYDH